MTVSETGTWNYTTLLSLAPWTGATRLPAEASDVPPIVIFTHRMKLNAKGGLEVSVTAGGEFDHIAMQSEYADMQVNQSLPLYSGPLVLYIENGHVRGKGRIEYSFSPSPSVVFSMEATGRWSTSGPPDLVFENTRIEVPSLNASSEELRQQIAPFRARHTDAEPAGKHLACSASVVTGYSFVMSGARTRDSFAGTFQGKLEHGTSSSLRNIRFHLVNFRDFADAIIHQSGSSSRRGRLNFDLGDWSVTLDSLPALPREGRRKRPHESSRSRNAKALNGYIVTHVGDLRRKDCQPFSATDTEEVLEFLYFYLSFANGSRTGPILPTGFDYAGTPVWRRWDSPWISPSSSRQSWLGDHMSEQCQDAASLCFACWQNSDRSDWFRSAVSLYLAGNQPLAGVEIAVAECQIALELLAWVAIVEENMVMPGSKFNPLPAADKFRKLLHWCGIPASFPTMLASLQSQFPTDLNVNDGPDAIIAIRNALIHAKKTKRKKLEQIPLEAKIDTWKLCLWYIELVILRLVGYSGGYSNRFSQRERSVWELVPWK